jgi:TolA-binding protein
MPERNWSSILVGLAVVCATASAEMLEPEERKGEEETKKPGDAVADYRRRIEATPEDKDPGTHYIGLGETLEREGRGKEAAAAYREYIEKRPQGEFVENCRLKLGFLLMSTSPAEAVSLFATIEANVSTDSTVGRTATYYKGKALYAQGKSTEAAKAFRKAVLEGPDDASGSASLDCLRQIQNEGKLGEAQGISADLKDFLSLRLDTGEGAKRALQEFEAKYPQSPLRNLAYVRAVEQLVRSRQFEPACALAKELLGRVPKGDEAGKKVNWLIGRGYYQEHKYKDALQCFEEYLAQDQSSSPMRMKVMAQAGVCLVRVNKKQEAERYFRIASESTDPAVRKIASDYLRILSKQSVPAPPRTPGDRPQPTRTPDQPSDK